MGRTTEGVRAEQSSASVMSRWPRCELSKTSFRKAVVERAKRASGSAAAKAACLSVIKPTKFEAYAITVDQPTRTAVLLEDCLAIRNVPRLKERALFVLAQSRSDKAHEIVGRYAKGG
jgi:hypothetical protein